VNEATSTAAGWRSALVALMLCLGWILFWYWETAAAMVTIWWRSETFAHAFLVLPISLWLIWRRRRVLAAIPPRPWWPAVPLLLAAGMGWLLGDLAAVNAVTQFALVAMIVLSVFAVLGLQVSLAMLFPLGFLFFAVPVGEFAMPQFIQWTADFTVTALRATGIPVYREGTHFVIPSGSWSVVEACSGIRYLIASVVVGTLYAYLSYRTLKKRLVFIGVAILVPIVANWLRAYIIVMLGHLSGNKLAVGVDHLIYGWVFFGFVMILMYMIGARWADNPDPDEADPVVGRPIDGKSRSPWPAVLAVLVAALLPVGWTFAILATTNGGTPRLEVVAPAEWQADAQAPDWQPAFGGAGVETHGQFRRGDAVVGLYVGYYRHQDYEHKLVSSDNVLVRTTDATWKLVGQQTQAIQVAGQAVTAHSGRLRAAADGRTLRAWQWYWINGRLTSNDYVAKGWTAWSRLIGQGDDSAVIVVFTADDDEAGDKRLADFVAAAGAGIDAALARARQDAGAGGQ
jgi:exosortase A